MLSIEILCKNLRWGTTPSGCRIVSFTNSLQVVFGKIFLYVVCVVIHGMAPRNQHQKLFVFCHESRIYFVSNYMSCPEVIFSHVGLSTIMYVHPQSLHKNQNQNWFYLTIVQIHLCQHHIYIKKTIPNKGHL